MQISRHHSTLQLRLPPVNLTKTGRMLAGILSLVSDSPISISPLPEIQESWPDDILADRLRLEDAVADLLRYSFVDREGERVRMHSVVQAFFKSNMSHAERGTAYAYASILVHSQTPMHRTNAEARRRFSDAVPHMEALCGKRGLPGTCGGLVISVWRTVWAASTLILAVLNSGLAFCSVRQISRRAKETVRRSPVSGTIWPIPRWSGAISMPRLRVACKP